MYYLFTCKIDFRQCAFELFPYVPQMDINSVKKSKFFLKIRNYLNFFSTFKETTVKIQAIFKKSLPCKSSPGIRNVTSADFTPFLITHTECT